MSMSKKIFSIVALLIIVAVAIMCLGLYSINTLNTQMSNMGQLAQRSIAMNKMDRTMLERRLAIYTLIKETATDRVNAANTQAQATEPAFASLLQTYQDNFPVPTPPEMVARVNTIQKLWGEYVRVSDEVARLGVLDTNIRAIEANERTQPFWDDIGVRLEQLAVKLAESDNAELARYRMLAQDTRVNFTLFRLNLNKLMTALTEQQLNTYEALVTEYVGKVDSAVTEIASNVPANIGGSDATKIAEDLHKTGKGTIEQVVGLIKENSNGRAIALNETDASKANTILDDYTNELMANADREMTATLESSAATGRFVNTLMIVISAIGIIVGIVLAYITISSIIKGLNNIIQGLGASSAEVNAAAGQISAGSQNLAEGSTEQAASLEETSSALEQMASMTRQNADNATKTNDTTIHNDKLIGEGANAVNNMSVAMGEISDSAEKISNIIKTIEEIAFNTNLLALNAAVEAARAGEAGKGFAVVADEVRNLAQRSAQAARDTTVLIQGTVDRVKNGSAISQELEASFKQIQEGSTTVGRLIAEITSATNEQAQGVDQVNTAVAQMDKVTQSNAATAEESASASEELSAQASNLNDMVQDLVALVEGRRRNGSSGGSRPSAGAPKMKSVKVTNVSSASRHDYSSPAPAPKSGGVKMLQASEVIPLGEDDDF